MKKVLCGADYIGPCPDTPPSQIPITFLFLIYEQNIHVFIPFAPDG